MREQAFNFDTGLKGGLRRLRTNPTNSESLIEAYNMRVGAGGLEAYEAIVNPIQGLPLYDWPYMQLFSTSLGLFVASSTNIYSVDGSYLLTSEISRAERQQRWSLADFGKYMVFANGSTPVERYVTSLDAVAWRASAATYTVNSVCNYNGQLVAGGFGTADNTVAWSRIGQVDLTTLLSLSTDDKTVSSGTKVMEWDGEVYSVLKLGKSVAVYGSGGISALIEATDPIGTFGYRQINEVGIAGRNAVAGGETEHLWVDKSGYVWLMKVDLQPKLLGYQEWMLALTDIADIVVSYDSQKGDWYISDGATTYLCNERGMTSVYQHPTSVAPYGGGLIGITEDGTNLTSMLCTDRLDFQNRDIKTVNTLEADVGTTAVYGAIDYKFNVNEDWGISTYKQFNKHGFCTPIMSGVELRLRLRWTDYTTFGLSYILARFKQTDRRSIRGTYVLPKSSGVMTV
jgi:hypothetical protein